MFSEPAYTKMFFSAVWLSVVLALFLINLDRKRQIYAEIVDFRAARAGLALVLVGLVGGVVTSLTGSGLDILTFAVLCLRYRISEKVATPASAVLMAWNSVVGFMTHLFLIGTPNDGLLYWRGDFQWEARNYWLVCIPVVVIGAPAGARFIKDKSRSVVTIILCSSILIQFLAAVWILHPRSELAAFSAVVFLTGSGLSFLLALSGRRRIDRRRSVVEPTGQADHEEVSPAIGIQLERASR